MPRRRSSRYGKAGLSGLFLLGLTVFATAQPLKLEVQEASAGVDQRTGEPIVKIMFKKEYARAFAEFSQRNLAKPYDLRVDGRTVAQPVIREAILGGSMQISGHFTAEKVTDLARSISNGAAVEVEAIDLTQYGPATGPLSPEPPRP